MTTKQVLFHSEAREKVLRGVAKLADAIRITLGPKSKSVLMQRHWGAPLVCNDGVTIAKEFELPDPEENLGAQTLRQAAEKTGAAVGDGTSTSTLLAHAIFAEGVRNVTAGASAIDLKRGLDRGLDAAVAALRIQSRAVSGRREMAQVASLSAHNDLAIGELVAEAMERVGRDGAITVDESKTTETRLEVVDGLQFDRGYTSPYFVTDKSRMQAVLDDPLILLTDRRLKSVPELLPLLEQLAKAGRPLLIVADDLEGDALATLVVNQMRGILRNAAVKAPGFGERRKALLEDLAILTGSEVLAEELGAKLEEVQLDHLGRAQRVVIDKDTTTIIGGKGRREAIDARMAQLRLEMEQTKNDYDRERLQERLAKLSGGVAVIHVGAHSEAELKARKDALDDAIHATKAAVAEGIVAGGGLALIRCVPAVARLEQQSAGDERTGLACLRRALEAPARQIAENSATDGGVVVARLMDGTGNIGFDAARHEYVDLFTAGIVDPTKVVRTSLENAVSVAGTLLLTEATMTELPVQRESASATTAEL
jgi:chaperonin GroEL